MLIKVLRTAGVRRSGLPGGHLWLWAKSCIQQRKWWDVQNKVDRHRKMRLGTGCGAYYHRFQTKVSEHHFFRRPFRCIPVFSIIRPVLVKQTPTVIEIDLQHYPTCSERRQKALHSCRMPSIRKYGSIRDPVMGGGGHWPYPGWVWVRTWTASTVTN